MAASNEPSYSATSIRNGMVAGYSAGICGIVVGHPLDSIKVLLQTNGGATAARGSTSGTSGSPAPTAASSGRVISRAYNSAAIAVPSSTVKANLSMAAVVTPSQSQTAMLSQGPDVGKRSLRALYAGAAGPLLTIGLFQSLNFAVYDSVRRVLYQRQLRSENPGGIVCNGQNDYDYLYHDNLSNVAMASFASGACLSVLTSPMMIVKTKQQLMVWGFRKAIKDTYSCGLTGKPHMLKGLRNFYTGYGIHFFCDAFGRSLYMFTYELLKRELAQRKSDDQLSDSYRASTQNLSIPERMLCAASAGMACWAFIFPADVVRSKLYARSLETQSSLTTLEGMELARRMIKEQGFGSLYRGMGITVARAGPVAAAILPVYDSVLDWISS